MSEMPIRQTYNNRISQGLLPYDMGTSRGEVLSAVWETPQLTGLVGQEFDILGEREGEYSTEQRDQIDVFMRDAQSRQDDLQSEWGAMGTTPERKIELDSQYTEIETSKELFRSSMLDEAIEAGTIVKSESLNEQYGDVITFDRDMSPQEAKARYEIKKAELIRQAIISGGPTDPLTTGLKFGTSLLTVATDPMELTIGTLAVLIPPASAALSARFGMVGGRVAQGVAEGAIAGTITEPFYFGLSQSQQLDYTMNDALLNIGLGAVLGGGIGGIAGGVVRYRTRGGATLDVPTSSIEVDAGNVALRQVINDEPVSLARFQNDLRNTTSLVSVNGVTFQSKLNTPPLLPHVAAAADMIAESIRPTVIVSTARGDPVIYATIQKADVVAQKTNGNVRANPDGGYTVRRPLSGEILRGPEGKPVMFTSERLAVKNIASMADAGTIPKSALPVPISTRGKPQWGIALDMSKEDMAAMKGDSGTLRIPDGVNTREPMLMPDGATKLDQAIKGAAAHKRMAREISQEALDADANVKTVGEVDGPPDIDGVGDVPDADPYREMVDQIDPDTLSDSQKADLEEITEIEVRAVATADTLKAGAACMARG